MLVAIVLDQAVTEDGPAQCHGTNAEKNHEEKEVENTVPLHGPQSRMRQVQPPPLAGEDYTCRMTSILTVSCGQPPTRLGARLTESIGKVRPFSGVFLRSIDGRGSRPWG
jgi:hypothetical protein